MALVVAVGCSKHEPYKKSDTLSMILNAKKSEPTREVQDPYVRLAAHIYPGINVYFKNPAEPTQLSAKPKRKSKNEAEEYTYADIAKHLEIPVQVFFRDIIQNLAWPEWVEYKKVQFRFQYKAALYASKAIQELFRMSQGKCDVAKKIVDQSIGRAWQGFVQLPVEQPQRQPYQQQQPTANVRRLTGLLFHDN